MRIVVLAGGIGGARFLRGLKQAVGLGTTGPGRTGPGRTGPDAPGLDTPGSGSEITVIGNTGDDIHLFGLKVCPDLDTVMYTLGGGIHEEQGWGRADESFSIKAEMKEYGVGPEWFGLGDKDFATHIVRTQMLGAGYPLSAVTEALCARWQPGVRLIPMSDDRVETHVLTDAEAVSPSDADKGGEDGEQREGERQEGGRRAVHFQEYWVRHHATIPAYAIIPVGAETAKPAPGVLEAIAEADVIIFPPSNPVVSVGTILSVPGIRRAVAAAEAPVIGLSPIIGGAPVRGMADKVLEAVGVESTAAAVARHYGSDLLDGWLVDESDAAAVAEVEAAGIPCRAVPLWMTDVDTTTAMAQAALAFAEAVRTA